MEIKQVAFYDKENECTIGGIMIDNHYIICGECGSVLEFGEDNIQLLKVYKNWADISEAIIGF